MDSKHSREEVRSAKAEASDRFKDDDRVTSVGIGMTEDRSDYAVTITVADERFLDKIPRQIGSVPVHAVVALNKFF